MACNVCYSQLTSDRLLSDLMWFLRRFWHIRYVEFDSFRNFFSRYVACKSYVEHLEFLDAKAKKIVRERNTLPSNVSWKSEKTS